MRVARQQGIIDALREAILITTGPVAAWREPRDSGVMTRRGDVHP